MIKGIQSNIALYKKVRYFRRDYNAPVTLDDLKDYRWQLLQKSNLQETEKEELNIIEQWVEFNDACYVLPNTKDITDIVQLDMCFSNEMFECMLPDLDMLIQEENKWVCVYHVMIYYNWMQPVDFYVWVDWLNERRSAINQKVVLNGSARRNVESYFKDINRRKWVLDEYLKEKGTSSPLTIQSFKRYCEFCDEVARCFNTINPNPLTNYR